MAGDNSVRYWRNPDLRPADDVRFWYVGKADRNGHMKRIAAIREKMAGSAS